MASVCPQITQLYYDVDASLNSVSALARGLSASRDRALLFERIKVCLNGLAPQLIAFKARLDTELIPKLDAEILTYGQSAERTIRQTQVKYLDGLLSRLITAQRTECSVEGLVKAFTGLTI